LRSGKLGILAYELLGLDYPINTGDESDELIERFLKEFLARVYDLWREHQNHFLAQHPILLEKAPDSSENRAAYEDWAKRQNEYPPIPMPDASTIVGWHSVCGEENRHWSEIMKQYMQIDEELAKDKRFENRDILERKKLIVIGGGGLFVSVDAIAEAYQRAYGSDVAGNAFLNGIQTYLDKPQSETFPDDINIKTRHWSCVPSPSRLIAGPQRPNNYINAFNKTYGVPRPNPFRRLAPR